MVTIIVDNSISRIEGLSDGLYNELYLQLGYKDQSASFALNKNIMRLAQINKYLNSSSVGANKFQLEKERKRLTFINQGLNKKLYTRFLNGKEFPTGLLSRVERFLKHYNQPYEINDIRVKPKLNQIKYVLREPFPALRYYQKEAYKTVLDKHRGILELVTGAGKTLLAAKIIWELGLKALIVTPGKEITDVMYQTMLKHFGKGHVGKLTTKSSKAPNIAIVNIQALIKLPPKLLETYSIVIIEEFHHASANTYVETNLKHLSKCFFRVGLSGTPYRSDGSDMGLESVLEEIVYTYQANQAFEDGFLVRPSFEIISNTCPYYETYQKEYKYGIVENDDRNKLIAEIAEHHKNDHTIIIVDQIEHGNRLLNLIPHAKFVHGMEKESIRQDVLEEFRRGELKCLIGTIIGEGCDFPIADTLIIANGGKARGSIIQIIGRVLRLFPGKLEALIYDFTDSESKYLSKHSEIRQEIYKEYTK